MKIKVAVNGYGVIGKRVADAVSLQDDMELTGVYDVVTDWRIKMAELKHYTVFASDNTFKSKMNEAKIKTSGTLDDLLASSDIIVDCTPKKIAAQNIELYKKLGENLFYREVKSMMLRAIHLVRKIIIQLHLTGIPRE